MFDRIPERLSSELQLDWGRKLSDICGVSATDILVMLTPFYVHYSGNMISRGNLVTALRDIANVEHKVDSFLNAFSVDKDKFTELTARRQRVEPELEYYAYNPLDEVPLIRVAQRRFVVPSRTCLIYAATSGLFLNVSNSLCDESGDQQTPADDDLGLLFETYCRDLMNYYLDAADVVGELEYDGKKWADAAIVKDDMGLVVECKTHGFGLEALGTGRVASAEQDLKKNLVKALSQVARYIRNVDEAAKEDGRLARVKSWLPIILLYEAPVPLNWPTIRDSVLKQLDPADRELVQDYQVLRANDFEVLMIASPSVHPVHMLYDKVENEPRGPVNNYVMERVHYTQFDRRFFLERLDERLRHIIEKYLES